MPIQQLKILKTMRIIKSRKDILFWIICLTWLLINILSYILVGSIGPVLSNICFVFIMVILIILKNSCRKFDQWLNREI